MKDNLPVDYARCDVCSSTWTGAKLDDAAPFWFGPASVNIESSIFVEFKKILGAPSNGLRKTNKKPHFGEHIYSL
jgi:hypothetical protein